MAHDVQNWRINLIEAYPRLFHTPTGIPEAAQGYPACDAGWQALLEAACTRIEAALAGDDTFRTLQIKQKFGTLRFYWTGNMSDIAKIRIEEVITLAEARSACTCEICGAEGRLHNWGGSLTTACSVHAKGKPVPVKPGHENLHFVRKFGPGETLIVSCRRYDRDTDSFIDVDPKSIGIER